MKQVILHVGMHKTGTTSIQEALAGYDDGRTCYAQLGGSNHSVPVSTIFSRRRDGHPALAERGMARAEVDTMRAGYLAALDAHLRDAARERLVISGEGIGSMREPDKRALVEHFTSRGLDVTVVCFTRDPASVTTSIVQQRIKGGRTALDKVQLDYRQPIEAFSRLLPRDRVIVHDFQSAIDSDGDVVAAFARICGLDTRRIPPVRRNESLSLAATRLMLLFNRLPLNTFGSQARFRARRQMIAALAEAFPNGPGAQIDRAIVNDLAVVNPAGLAFLREGYGISYAGLPRVGRLGRVKAYLGDLSEIDYAGLHAIMDRMGLDHRPDDDPAGWLASLIHAFARGTALTDADTDRLHAIATTIADGGTVTLPDAVALLDLAARARPDDRTMRRALKQLRRRA